VITTTYAIRLSFRRKHGWGYEVAAAEGDRNAKGLGAWHATRAPAEVQLDALERCYPGSTLRGREQLGCD